MNVDFYVFEDAGRTQALRELCLLLEKPYQLKDSIYIYAASSSEAEQLDKLLWTYRDDSFLAHQLLSENPETTARIQISTQAPSITQNNILVNLSGAIPNFYQQFKRVIEIVFTDSSLQQAARERFRLYREQGCDIQNT